MTERDRTKIKSGELKEVDFAKEFKKDIRNSAVLEFESENLRDEIMSAEDDEVLVVTSTINSPKTVQEVVEYNEEFLKS